MATKAELAIDLPVPSDQAFDATYRALGSLGFGVVHADPAVGIISAKSSLDLMSWGENLELYVQPVTATSSTVIVRSALKFGLVDWGKNKKNVAKVETAIRAQLSAFPGAITGPGPGPASGVGVVPEAGAAAPPPPPPPPPPPGPPAAGWHPDPSGRHQHRWWDGIRWTDSVSTNGTQSTDRFPPPGLN